MEDMKKKLVELAKANEELVNKNTKLLGKLKKADRQIIELEKERKADKNEINALKKQLRKGAKHAQTKQIICVTEEKEEEEDRSKPVEEEEYKCREEQPGTEEFFEQVAEPVPLRKIFPEDDEPNKEQQAGGLKKHVKQKGLKQTVETGSIERDVNLKKRGAQKRIEEEWEYDTPEGLKPAKRTKEVEHKVQNRIVIDGVNYNTDTWKLLDEKVANHYKNLFDLNKDENDDFRYWECCDGIIDITKDDLKRIIQEREITSNTIRVYLAMLKEEMEKKNVSIGFLDIEAARTAVVHEQKLKEFLAGGGKQGEFKCNELDIELSIINPLWSIFSKDLVFIPVKHIMVFIKRVYDSTKYPLSQGLDPKEWRENYDKQDSQGIVVDSYSMMSAEEKRTRRWMLDQNVYQARYKLKDILSCPQQNKTSSDCGPFLLHFIESLCHRENRQKMAVMK
ncbi:hypothetical protein ACLB2K_001990 [Fragaria x ananassa]